MHNVICTSPYPSPVGMLLLGSINDSICLCDWDLPGRRAAIDAQIQTRFDASYRDCESDIICRAKKQLDEYFAGRRTQFEIPLSISGTPFQQLVRQALLNIPFGHTRSYKEIAQIIGRPRAVRAAASAIAANPISIFVPCHRVIAVDNSPAGYAGGLLAKQYLLQLEARNSQ